MRETHTEVLVVGAGPVGLSTALLLAEAGIQVRIIDREERTAARSYACALHPRTLKALQSLGLAEALLEQGRRASTVAFYEGQSRQAEIRLSELGGDFPFLLILPQALLEKALEERLKKAGVEVYWNHRFGAMTEEQEGVVASIDELEGTGTGYIVPHWETVVKKRAQLHAQFLVGADGQNSSVRQHLNIRHQSAAGPAFFAAYEFVADAPAAEEVRVVLDETTTNVLWPLPGTKCRWTFQVLRSEVPNDFPEKERRLARLSQANVDERIRQYVQKVTDRRAPWFKAQVRELLWCTEVAFQHRVVRHFGRNRSWLAGDAAHQTGPVGVQSMNAGFAEAERLAAIIRDNLKGQTSPQSFQTYDLEHQEVWRALLGLTAALQPTSQTPRWVRERCSRLLPCLPGVEADLAPLAGQLGLDFALSLTPRV